MKSKLLGQVVTMSRRTLHGMILTCVCSSALIASNLNAQNLYKSIQDIYLSVEVEDAPIKNVLNQIETETGFAFAYNSQRVNLNQRLSIQLSQSKLSDILMYISKKSDLKFKRINEYIHIGKRDREENYEVEEKIDYPDTIVSGQVTSDDDPEGLPAVNIIIKGTTVGAVTDSEGRYTIDVPGPETVLVFTSVGYVSREVKVGNQSVINIVLQMDVQQLEQLVVIGYGKQERSKITGAISSVYADDFSGINAVGVQDAIQGRVAGVLVTPTSGMPGGAIDMNIRGVATFGNGNPLYVIDGVPVLTEVTNRNFNPLANLNPENIESIEILKDASASAIYGARAANGVVLITTNRGSAGATRLQMKASGGVSKVTQFLPMMTTEQWIPYSAEAYENAGRPIPVAFEEPLLSENLMQNTDWQEEAFKPASTQDYWLGVSGGGENSNFAFSVGYLDQEGTLPTSGFKRYSTRINSDFQISDRLQIGQTVEISRAIWTGTFDQTSSIMRQLNQQAPTVPVYDPDALGGFDGPRLEYGPVGRQNSIGALTLDGTEYKSSKVLGSTYIDFEILPGLSNRFSAGGDVTFGETFQFLPRYVMGDRNRTVSVLNESTRNENAYIIEDVLTYQHNFNNVHELAVVAGYTQQKSSVKTIGVQVRDFPNDDLRSIGAAFEERDINGIEGSWALQSLFGRLNYTYDNRYNIMAVIRRDGSSRFGRNNRYGTFPSVSGSWIITNEKFMNVPGLSNLSLRASVGQVGSADIDDFAQYATVEQGVNYVFGEGEDLAPGSTYLSVGNSDLKWEVTTQTNIGLDLSILNGQLSFAMDYYIKNTDDLLLQLPVPTTSGIRRDNGAFVNAGSMRNQGFEFSTNYQKTLFGDMELDVGGFFSSNKNEVTFLEGGLPIIAERRSGKQTSLAITKVGSPISSFYGYVMEGIFSDQADVDNHASQLGSGPGDVIFSDLNGDGTINADDQTIIGNPFPDFIYGFNMKLRYKNFDFVLLFHGKQGQDLYNHVWADLNEGEGDNNQTTELLDRWTPDNRDTNVPRAITGNPGQNTRPSSRFIENASFLRIQNVQLGYNLSPILAGWWNVTRMRVYLSVNNLHTFTNYQGYNPEIGKLTEGSRSSLIRGIDHAMYPIPRTIEAGIQIDFN